MEEAIKIKNKCGESLSGILSRNKKSKDLIIICHGSRGNKEGQLQKTLSKNLVKKFNIFRFDFSGNGESEGRLEDSTYTKDIEDLLIVVRFFKNKFNIKAVIGHSKSGTEVLLASKRMRMVGIIIALSPRIKLFNSQEWQEYQKRTVEVQKKGYYMYPNEKTSHRVTKRYLADIKKWEDVGKGFKEKENITIIHGTLDEVINIKETREFTKRFRKIKLFEVRGANHGFHRHLKELSKKIIEILG